MDDFTYLGSNISAENSVQKNISARINKARSSYCSLCNIWKSNIYSLKTKLRLFNSNVISVLLYGCQSWRVSKDDMNKLDVFQTKHPDTEAQIEMVGPCSTNATKLYPKSCSEMDANRKT